MDEPIYNNHNYLDNVEVQFDMATASLEEVNILFKAYFKLKTQVLI